MLSKGEDNHFPGPVTCVAVNITPDAVGHFCYQCTLPAQVQFTVPRYFSPERLPSSSVLRWISWGSCWPIPPVCHCLCREQGPRTHIDWSLHFVIISKLCESELCLVHQMVDKDCKQDTLMSPETLLELRFSFLKYFIFWMELLSIK